jgi:hydroxyethylthiazole kinase-like uncharacterized protein yjeF
VIEAFGVQDVRTAEEALMATLDASPTPDGDGELMARAVNGLATVAALRADERGAERVVGLVGPGNNGADTLYALARLARDGRTTAAVHHEAAHEHARTVAAEAGVALVPAGAEEAAEVVGAADLVLDGILGIGGRPGLPDWARAWVEAVDDDAYVLAVDLPSGQDPAGEVLDGDGIFADETVTFSVAKPVHVLPPTEQAVGLLTVVDIGLQVDAAPAVRRVTVDDVPALWPVPGAGDDKYSRGVVGIIAGSESYTGAAVLACTAAVTAGAGMVRYVGTPTPEALVRATVPEAVHGVGRVQAWVIGPGLDTASRAKGAKAQLDAAREALGSDLPVVVDAGGLELVTGRRDAPTLLTPHAGEAARLLTRLGTREVTRPEVEAHPLRMARHLAEATGATVLLKGATTVVTGAEGTAFSQAEAPGWLATAGAGDVLSGLVGTLVAAGLPLELAGALGALVHGRAADRANPGGPLRALDVAHALGPTVAALLRG